MKTLVTLAVTLVLTASLFVGCGCTNRNNDNTSAPTVLPTNEELWNTTEATTRATTESTTVPMTTDSTTETGSIGNTDGTNTTDSTINSDATNATEGPLERSARRMMPGSR